MKQIIVLQLILIIGCNSIAQQKESTNNKSLSTSETDLIGIWQADTSLNGAAWLDNYQFFPTARFVFNFNEYDSNKRMKKFTGTYRIKNDTLYLNIEKLYMFEGGKFTRGATSWEDEWILKDPQIEITKIENESEYTALITSVQNKSRILSFYLDNRKYFKMSNDPEDY